MRIRPREHIVLVVGSLGTDATVDEITVLSQRRLTIQQIAVTLDIAMQRGNAVRYLDTLGIVPGTGTDSIAGIDRRLGIAAMGT